MLNLFPEGSPLFTMLIFALLIIIGLGLGQVRLLGISLGSAGVLFAGLFLGHFGLSPDGAILSFVGNLGLVLFVYALGLQIGPAFIDSLKSNGLKLNALALLNIILALAFTVIIFLLSGIPKGIVGGLLAGSTTNTPSLGEAQQIMSVVFGTESEQSQMPGLGYAIAYPLGVLGHIGVLILLSKVFRININKEKEDFDRERHSQVAHLSSSNVELNANYHNKTIAELPFITSGEIAVSRIYHEGKLKVAGHDEIVCEGDRIFARGEDSILEEFISKVGHKANDFDLRDIQSDFVKEEIILTNKDSLGKSLDELHISGLPGMAVRGIERSGMLFAPLGNIKLQFADVIKIIGKKNIVDKVAAQLGNSIEDLREARLLPVFAGIVLGLLLGGIPILIPGLPNPVRLGLACGPLLIAILFSNLRRLGKINFYLPYSSSEVLKEMGLAFFLASIGLRAGEKFVMTLSQGDGLYWMGLGALITIVPALIVGVIARMARVNFIDICGMLSGSMTAPHVLAFTYSFTQSRNTSLAYTTVYPLSLGLRVIFMQIFLLSF